MGSYSCSLTNGVYVFLPESRHGSFFEEVCCINHKHSTWTPIHLPWSIFRVKLLLPINSFLHKLFCSLISTGSHLVLFVNVESCIQPILNPVLTDLCMVVKQLKTWGSNKCTRNQTPSSMYGFQFQLLRFLVKQEMTWSFSLRFSLRVSK